jgi:glucose/arabinose dehydrogenase
MKKILFMALLAATAGGASAQEPDGLILPPGFHASVVAEGLGPLRHLAVRPNGDIYASTGGEGVTPQGLLAIRLGPDHKPVRTEHFSSVNGGTGIRFYHGMLYAASDTAVYRFGFDGDALVPGSSPETVVDGMPKEGNRPLAFDGKGGLYVGVDAISNVCLDEKAQTLVAPNPCPELKDRGGIWKFDADRIGQSFAAGEKFATGQRDITGMDWSGSDGALYAAMHGRDGSHHFWPKLISQRDDDNIGDELFRLVAGSDMGWPYSYYDGARKLRLVAPEYGGDGKKIAPPGRYATPVLSLFPMRAAPVDVMVYDGAQFPKSYQGGLFLALHGTGGVTLPQGRNGYRVVFVPLAKGKAGKMQVFADGFAGPAAINRNSGKATYRPIGLATAPDGSLYVADSNKGRIWRISYGG